MKLICRCRAKQKEERINAINPIQLDKGKACKSADSDMRAKIHICVASTNWHAYDIVARIHGNAR